MTDEPITGTLAVHVLSESVRLLNEKLEAAETESDGYVREIVSLSATVAELRGRLSRLEQDHEGSYRANVDMHRRMVEAMRERDELRREVGR